MPLWLSRVADRRKLMREQEYMPGIASGAAWREMRFTHVLVAFPLDVCAD